MTPCASISFCRQACRLDVGESVADLSKRCCMGTQNLMHSACCVWLLYDSGFFLEDKVSFAECVFSPSGAFLKNAQNKVLLYG